MMVTSSVSAPVEVRVGLRLETCKGSLHIRVFKKMVAMINKISVRRSNQSGSFGNFLSRDGLF